MIIGDEDFEGRVERALEVGQTAYGGRPEPQSWGMSAYGEGPSGIGGGEIGFYWFSSENELLDYVELHLAFDPPGPPTIPIDSMLASVSAIIEKLKNRQVEREPARLALNNALSSLKQIEWWGPRSELFKGDFEFCRSVREGFRDDGEIQHSNGPIAEEEEEDFLDYLEAYGI
jgi:hypothetical protein